jgi:CHAD domain-containing protein
MKGFLEREVKLDPGASFALPELPGRPLDARVFTSTYYDSPPRSLARSGITLRRRVENGLSRWQLKIPREDGRDELEAPGGPAGPPPELAKLLKAHARHGKLAPVATLRTHRSGVRVADGERSLADVTFDAVDILDNGHAAGSFAELEVELVDGDDADLDRLSRRLRRAGARRTDGQPKLMRVLDLEADPTLDQSAALGEQLRFLLARSLHKLESQDPGVRLGEDPEALHRFRLATRRARALIRCTSPLVGDALAPLDAELRWLTGLLGPVRDLDVLLERLQTEVRDLDVDRKGGELIVAMLQEAREEARDVLLAGLGSPRYMRLLALFEAALPAPAPLDESAGLRPLGGAAFAKLRKAADRLPDDPSSEEMHALRMRSKRAGHAAELAGLDGDARIGRFVAAAGELQDVLGEHHDAVVAEERIRGASHRFSTATAAGRLIEREHERRRLARAAYPAVLAAALTRGRKAFP